MTCLPWLDTLTSGLPQPSRALRKAGYHGRNMRRKPFVSKVNRKKRIDFAKENEKQDRNSWNSVIFSDASKFNIHGSDGYQKVWKKANAALEPKNMRGTVKHGGGSITINLSQSSSKLRLDGSFTFQQDNDPKHTARVVREWLLYNVRKQVKTSPQSPNLNLIEHLWDYLDRQIRKQEIKIKNNLKKALLEGWQKIPSSVTQNLVKSVPSRLKPVIKAKGYPINF
ncbi:transposable element Tcb2 transposase [Trichonephila clavipes]|nr:transposable element Tcb2 transposase [Trichonephila clavipes]